MINLLPKEDQKELLQERNKKLAVVLANIALMTLVCLALILFSLKLYILSEVDSQEALLRSAQEQYETPAFLELKQTVKKYNSLLVKVSDLYKDQIYFSGALETIFSIARADGLYFNQVTLNKDGEKIKVIASGVSDTRENLLLFKENIEKNPNITDVVFPPQDWINPTDIVFNVNFKMTPGK